MVNEDKNIGKAVVGPIEGLIGTDTCSYCGVLTECLCLPDYGEAERVACRDCIVIAFAKHW